MIVVKLDKTENKHDIGVGIAQDYSYCPEKNDYEAQALVSTGMQPVYLHKVHAHNSPHYIQSMMSAKGPMCCCIYIH